MSPVPANQLDLTAPPVVRKIYQRSLIVGVVFSIASIILAITNPDQFYRGYLLGFLCWLGVSLGSMSIVMIRHLTGGGWGMVIRRILGAAMRTLPCGPLGLAGPAAVLSGCAITRRPGRPG